MIDYFALFLGHALLAIALMRLVMRDDVDVDPQIKALSEKAAPSLAQRRRDAARADRQEAE